MIYQMMELCLLKLKHGSYIRPGRSRGARVGIVFVTLSRGLIPYSFSLLEICSNNVAEYEAFVIGLKLAFKMHIDHIEVFSDSQLIIRQIHGQYKVRNAKLVPLYQRAKKVMSSPSAVTFKFAIRSS